LGQWHFHLESIKRSTHRKKLTLSKPQNQKSKTIKTAETAQKVKTKREGPCVALSVSLCLAIRQTLSSGLPEGVSLFGLSNRFLLACQKECLCLATGLVLLFFDAIDLVGDTTCWLRR
jgi:hypothetical protein